MRPDFSPNRIHFFISEDSNTVNEIIHPLIQNGFLEADSSENGFVWGRNFPFGKLANFRNQSGRKSLKQMIFLISLLRGKSVNFDNIYQVARIAQEAATSLVVIARQNDWQNIFYLLNSLGTKPVATQENARSLIVSCDASELVSRFSTMLCDLRIPNLEEPNANSIH